MIPEVTIDEKGCRGCTLCADTCPGLVFEVDHEKHMAKVVRAEDCIGCRSCIYLCPSACIHVGNVHPQRPFHRTGHNVEFVEKFVQSQETVASLTKDDWKEAYDDVAATLTQLARAMEDMVGRGSKAVGRQAGKVGASHLPEMYEESTLPGLMERLQKRFQHAIDFQCSASGDEVNLTLSPCRMATMLEGTK
ncbi:MAG: hypothetical protein H6729_01855 [Deltaproteobacteria bacterium]|nr:hypothetical protein [Deltaproteobacteria bacterium]